MTTPSSTVAPLIDAESLQTLVREGHAIIIDARASLADPQAGQRAFERGHVPGAVFADLLRDLSGTLVPGATGRHPLPDSQTFTETLRRFGVEASRQVVAYDDGGGMFAARVWWLLHYFGHERASVLDGGLAAWVAAGGRLTTEDRPRPRSSFEPRLRPELRADAADVLRAVAHGSPILDARAPERFRGEVEPIDPIAGHIPSAENVPFAGNLEQGHFVPPATLRERFASVLAGGELGQAIVYCGSGVTACHHVLAAAHAGLAWPRLYPGSWSEWIADPTRPVARG